MLRECEVVFFQEQKGICTCFFFATVAVFAYWHQIKKAAPDHIYSKK